ncbi:thioesterase II family protein [Crossiella cryophila]|uniref:Surfactin synthase thioesterase subunit n=1 Tax=Crossiella cryophila TaxID=43355 RepID=A0A7W7FTL0_9PSEU|nr:alpha/beta fold hydrolase [Crossiella cryophila]MBB4677105.1 surfactin synthase thioesterase subunit [Crossiella cryophila]
MTADTGDNGLWLRRFHPVEDSKVRLACFPHAGGSASFFYPFSAALTPSIEVLAVQYPGRQDRRADPRIENVQEFAREIVKPLLAWTDKPLALFGHSMGASIAFEVATILEQEFDFRPAALFASGRRAPSRHRDERVHQQSDDGIVAELQRLSGTDSALLGDEELLRMVLPAIRSDYKAAETYRWQGGVPLSCPITAIVGESDPRVTFDEATTWSEHTRDEFALRTLSGGHFYLNHHQSDVVNEISDQLISFCAKEA